MKRIILIVCAVVSLFGVVKAQDGNNTSFFLSNLPQQYRLNPSYQPEYKVFIGLPALSGISVNYLNSSFTPEDLLYKKNDSVYMDINKFYKALRKRNFISFNNEISIFSLGVKAKSWYATFDITQRNDFLFRVNKDLFTFLKEGNADHPNMDMGKLGVNEMSYLEVGFGLSKQVNEKLTVGARVKYLLGIANADMTDSELSVNTLQDGTMKLHSRQNIRLAMPFNITDKKGKPLPIGQPINWDEFDIDSDNIGISSFLNAKNSGVGFDLGGTYKFDSKLTFFASLTDLGFIRWGNNTYTFYQDETFDWEGVNIDSGMINGNNNPDGKSNSLDDAFQDLVDTLKNNFRLKSVSGGYTTMLSPKLNLGATYQLNRVLNVGGLFRASLVDGMFLPSLTASVNARPIRNFSASVSYSIIRGSYVNLGAGLTAKLGPFQLYASVDNVLAANYTNTQAINTRVGLNLLFGHKDKKKKKKKKTVEQTPIEVVVAPVPPRKDTVQQDTTPVDTIMPVVEEKVVPAGGEDVKDYYVIVGSFNSKERADALKKRLDFMGFKESVVLQNEAGKYRVSAASFDSHSACWDEVFRIRKEYPKYADTWGLSVMK